MIVDSVDKFYLKLVPFLLWVLFEIEGHLAGYSKLSCDGLLNLSWADVDEFEEVRLEGRLWV